MKRQVILVAAVSVVVGVILSQALSLMPTVWSRVSNRLGGLFGGGGGGGAGGGIISTFESDTDLKKWETNAARIERVAEHATEGRYAAKATLFGGGQMCAIRIEDGFERRQAPRDWRRFERIEWKMFNATSDHQRLILQLKDDNGRRFKKDIWLAPNQQTDVRIFLDTVGSSLNLARIDQFSLFRWEPQGDVTLFIDDIRLLGVGQEAVATPPPAPAAGGAAPAAPSVAGSAFTGLLGGFENDQELKAWRPVSAVLTRATEHVTEGRYAAKLLLRKTEEMAGLKLDDLPRGGSDWSRYQTLAIDLFNATAQQQRFLIEIKDGDDQRFKHEVFIEPNSAMVAQCSLTAADASLDLARVVQVSVYQWNPDADALVYLDNARLLRAGDPLAAAVTASAAASSGGSGSGVISPVRVPGFDTHPERWQASDPADPTRTFVRVPLSLDEQAGIDGAAWPWTGGVPFPQGTLRLETPVRLTTADGAVLPLQTRPLAFWDDGSIRWLLVDTQADAVAAKRLACFLDYGDGLTPEPVASPLAIEETAEAITVTTGPLRFSVSRSRGNLFEGVWLDQDHDGTFSREEWIAGGGDLTMGHNGVTYRSSRDAQSYQTTIEERGPLRTVIRASGWFRDEAGNGFGQFIVRIHAFRGEPFVRLEHTFIYTGYPENTYHFVYEGLALPANETIEEISLELPVDLDDEGRTCAFGDLKGLYQGPWTEPVELWQSNHSEFSVLTPGGGEAMRGQRLLGWIDVADGTHGVAVALRDCWQQFPKAFEADPQQSLVTVRLWPSRSGELDLKTTAEAYGPDAVARGSAFGLAKTHEIYCFFHTGSFKDANGEALVRKIQEPSLVRATPEWIADSRALGWLHPYDKAMRAEEGFMGSLFDWAMRQRDAFNWYGMLDYGDTLSWHRDHDDDGTTYPAADWHPVGRWGWYNCEVMGTHTGALLQYIRTGQWAYFQFGEDLARHIEDVDTCHYNTVANDPRLRDLIRDEYSQPGSMHRHNANHWGDRNEETSHTNIAGMTLYYYLTGSWRTLDVLQEVGQFLSRDPVTYSQHPDIAPQRSIANLIWGEVNLYEVTGDRQHLERAGKWVTLFVESQGADGSWQENYDPTSRSWQGEPKNLYTAEYTLPALIAYHRVTGDRRVAEAIVKGTDYLMTKEVYLPYFHALGYAYELTGDLRYKRVAAERFKSSLESQRENANPLERGMVFQKPIYHRPNLFLYSLPYGLGLMAHSDAELRQWAQAGASGAGREALSVKREARSKDVDTLDVSRTTNDASRAAYQIAVASSLVKVFRERERFPGTDEAWTLSAPAVALSAARGEAESAQLVLYSAEAPLLQVGVSVSPLKHIAGFGEIPSEAVSVRPVGYVRTRQPDYEVSYVGWWPDPLTTEQPFQAPRGQLAPVWLTVTVPTDALPGEYRGTIEVKAEGEAPRQVPISVRVRSFALPRRGHLATAFDFYPSRLEKAYREFYPDDYRAWRSNLGALEERFYQRMLDYRLSPILNLDPTQPVMASRLEEYVRRGLTAVAIGSHGGSFDNDWPESLGLQGLVPSYRKFAEALRRQEALDVAYVYAYDEPPFGKHHVAQVAAMLHEADPALRTLVTFQDMPDPREWTAQHLEWLKPIDIVCGRNVTLTPQQIEALRGLGKEVWMYVSGPAPPYPTLALDYPAIAYRVLPWMCWKYHVTGLLYWCVNFWRTDPWVEPMNTEWRQNGNGSLFYPGAEGPVDSIRLEVLRDGLEDYEYLCLLRSLVAEAERGEAEVVPGELLARAKTLLEVGEDLVRSFSDYAQDPSRIAARREAIAEVIEQLIGQRTHAASATGGGGA